MPQHAIKAISKTDHTLDSIRPLFAEEMQRVDRVIFSMTASEVPLVAQMAHYIIAAGGKRLRPILTILAAKLCGYRHGERHINLAASIEFIHTATLLHDDVVDESTLRRGEETANRVWGNAPSVLVGDFLLSRAFQLMVRDESPRVPRVLSDAAATITQGEVNQLIKKSDLNISQEDYIGIIAAKTAALFAAACEVGAVVSEKGEAAESALHDFGRDLGIAFQIIDDALDYSAAQEELGKTIGDDFREGKVTLPVILAYQKASMEEKDFWRGALAERKQKPGDLIQAIAFIRKAGALKDAAACARGYAEKARAKLRSFPDSLEKQALEKVLSFAVNRPY